MAPPRRGRRRSRSGSSCSRSRSRSSRDSRKRRRGNEKRHSPPAKSHRDRDGRGEGGGRRRSPSPLRGRGGRGGKEGGGGGTSSSNNKRPREAASRSSPPKPAKVAVPADLPIAEFRAEILRLLVENPFIVIVGETGSGKTTQIPQYLLDSKEFRQAVYGGGKAMDVQPPPSGSEDEREQTDVKQAPRIRIAITQPRRVAAVAMAKRVCAERGARLGDAVGYTIRFEDRAGPMTQLRYMTDGCLLRECLLDPELSGYHVVVLDEAHERSLHTDVLFALMKHTVERRAAASRPMRVVVTSATLNTEQFSKYFNNCPVLEVPGRKYKVDVHFHPVSKTQRVESAVNVAINLHFKEGPGHILVFLTGMDECEQAVALTNTKLQALVDSGKEVSDCLIFPLYGMMQSDDQRNVFEEVDENCRKLIFCTNIAETSLTVAGVGFVVDCGYCKQKNFNPKTGMESLLVTEVSQVQATQRAGRAGRTQDGKCFRLYTEESFTRSFPKVTVPEILRSNLSSVCLQMKVMGIHDVVRFDFMEPPDRVRLVRSLRILYLLGAIDEDGKVTDLGRSMAQFPLEPQFARTLIASEDLGCTGDALTLVSLLSSEGIWYRPSRQDAEEVHMANRMQASFSDRLGDHLTLLNVFQAWEENGCDQSWCKKHYLHHRALRQAKDIRGQLCEQLEKARVSLSHRPSRKPDKTALLKALCHGFYMQSARMCSAGGGWLIAAENVLVRPEGGSVLDGTQSEWLIFTELVGATISNCMMRNVSAVDHDWLKPLLPKLVDVDMKRLVGEEPAKKAKPEVPEKDAATLAKEKEVKLSSARDRYLARKAKT